jgi:hypothetical protein
LNENLQKMVEFTTARGLVETPIAESPTSHDFAHCLTTVITSSHCPMSRKRRCQRLKRADEYSKKNKYTPRGEEKLGIFCVVQLVRLSNKHTTRRI